MSYSTSVLKLYDPNGNNALIYNMFALRKEQFVDRFKWHIDHFGDIEVDQYDNPNSRYVVVHKGNQVFGCTRLLPTTNAVMTGYTYMIRDASHGKLAGLPSNLICDAPVDPNIWEATRFAVAGVPNSERNKILKLVCEGAVNFAKDHEIREILGLMSPFFLRWLPRNGFNAVPAGPTTKSGTDPICVIRHGIN